MAFRTLVLATLGLAIPWSCCSQDLLVDSIQIETVPERIKGALQNFTAFCTSQSSSKQPCSATVQLLFSSSNLAPSGQAFLEVHCCTLRRHALACDMVSEGKSHSGGQVPIWIEVPNNKDVSFQDEGWPLEPSLNWWLDMVCSSSANGSAASCQRSAITSTDIQVSTMQSPNKVYWDPCIV